MAVMMVTCNVQAFIEYEGDEDYELKLDALMDDIEECGKNRNTGFRVDVEDESPMEEQRV